MMQVAKTTTHMLLFMVVAFVSFQVAHSADCRKCNIVLKSDQVDCAQRRPHDYICRDDGECLRKGLDCCCLNLCGGTQCVKFPTEENVAQHQAPTLPRARLGVGPTEPPHDLSVDRDRYPGYDDKGYDRFDRNYDRNQAGIRQYDRTHDRTYFPDDEYYAYRKPRYNSASSHLAAVLSLITPVLLVICFQ